MQTGIRHMNVSSSLLNLFTPVEEPHGANTRESNRHDLVISRIWTYQGENSLEIFDARIRKMLPNEVREVPDLDKFKQAYLAVKAP